MAGLNLTINGLKVIKNAVLNLLCKAEFKEGVSEEYKEGFYDFGNALINTLDVMDGELNASN